MSRTGAGRQRRDCTDELGETFAKNRSIVYATPASRFKLVDYGLSWVFEDDVEGAAAFKVSVALA